MLIEYGYYLNLCQKHNCIADNLYLFKDIQDIDNEILVIQPGQGFFSNCTVRLFDIVIYFNSIKKVPLFIDGSKQFELYKHNTNMKDITYEYFQDDLDYKINYIEPIDFRIHYQYIDYNKLNFTDIIPFIKKYFTPNYRIKQIIKYIEKKYEIINYDNNLYFYSKLIYLDTNI